MGNLIGSAIDLKLLTIYLDSDKDFEVRYGGLYLFYIDGSEAFSITDLLKRVYQIREDDPETWATMMAGS